MGSSEREDDLNDALIDEVRRLPRPEAVESLSPETAEDIASLAARVEALERLAQTLDDSMRELRGIVRNPNRSQRFYQSFRH